MINISLIILIQSGEESSRVTEEMVQTATGPIMVAREGDPRKPAIVTYHDLALNYLSNFSVREGGEKQYRLAHLARLFG